MKWPWEVEAEEKAKKEKEKTDEVEFKPADVKAKFDKIDSMETEVKGLNEKLKSLDTVTAYIARQEKEENDRKAAAAKKVREEKEVKETEELDFLTDPAAATEILVNKKLGPLVHNAVQGNARVIAQEHFDNNQNFEYFTDPTFKAEVMKLIFSLPTSTMTDVNSMENCYHVVAGRNAAAIKEGKIKSRFTAASSSATGTGAEGTKSDQVIVLNADQKKAAKMFNMTEKEYAAGLAKERTEASYV